MARPDSFEEFEATSLFCPRCRRATPARKKLLLVLPSGNKYDYVCAECGPPAVARPENDRAPFHDPIPPPPRRPSSNFPTPPVIRQLRPSPTSPPVHPP